MEDLRNKTDYLRPYELLERILTRHGARQRLMGRLGPEAEDGIDALLSQALAYETTEIPSLTGFVAWAITDAFEVKRQLSEATNMVRVMTVHGAKGLEAPIVILPDTIFTKRNPGADQLLKTTDHHLLWNTRTTERPDRLQEAVSAQQQKEQEERLRLLYVAMTRAQSWLVVAGAGDVREDETKNWYTFVQQGIQQIADLVDADEMPEIAVEYVQQEKDMQGNQDSDSDGKILRLSCGNWSAQEQQRDAQPSPQQPGLPAHLLHPPQRQEPVAVPSVINPSKLDGDKALPGEAGLDPESAKARGTAIHRLLEMLPTVPPPPGTTWPPISCSKCLQDDHSFGETEREGMIQEAVEVLKSPALAEVFAEDALVEVGFSVTVDGQPDGRPMQGVMDRVLVRPHKVLVVDFKTNATVPPTP